MGCCCAGNDEQHNEGLAVNRKCRDVLFLLFFVAYWVGMFVVCGIAFREGDPKRLVYGLDSHGLLCGSNTTYKDTVMDLTGQPYLYYLDALELLEPANLMYARTVCMAECPSTEDLCSLHNLPCTNGTQYVCPYYRTADQDLWTRLPDVPPTETAYWSDLADVQMDKAQCSNDFVSSAFGSLGMNLSSFGVDLSICNGADSTVSGAYLQASSQFPGKGPCYPVFAATVPYFNRCFPKFPPEVMNSAYSMLNTSAGVLSSAAATLQTSFTSGDSNFGNYIADISKGILIIVIGGLACGMVLSLVWMLILRYFAGVMAWVSIITVNVALLGCTLYAYNMAGLLTQAGQWGATIAAQLPTGSDPTGLTRDNWSYIAYALTAVTVIIFLFTIAMLRRIQVAVACIKVASQAVATMPSVLLWPLLPFVLEVGLIVYWVAVTAVLYSAGEPSANWRQPAEAYQPLGLQQLMLTNSSMTMPAPAAAPDTTNMTAAQILETCAASSDCYISYDWNARLKYAFIFHLFGLLWTNQFIVGLSSVVVAGAVANFYWSRGDPKRQPTFPVLKSLRNTMIYHLGSVALGAFIIAIIQFVRLVLEYIDKKTRAMQQQNQIAAWAMCIVRGLVWLLEKIVAFINRNAFILVAVKGSNYCSSAARAVSLIVSNALRLAAVNIVGDALLFLGKLGVAGCCGIVAFAISNLEYYHNPDKYPSTYLSSAILPIALAVLTGYIVAQIFFAVYEMAIDTVLLSFCEDCERNSGHPRCAPQLLLEAIGESKAAASAPAAVVVGHPVPKGQRP